MRNTVLITVCVGCLFLLTTPVFAADKIMGSPETGTGNVNMAPTNISYCQSYPVASQATITSLSYYDAYGGIGTYTIDYAIYTDNAGIPGNFIASTEYHETVGSGWKTGPFPSTPINPGTYWICIRQDPDFELFFNSAFGSRVYKVVSPFTWTNPYGTPDATLTDAGLMVAAYGTFAGTPSPTPAPKPGDANGDGKVDETDYSIWLSFYGQTVTGGARNGDFDGNGTVDGVDFAIWLTNYGT